MGRLVVTEFITLDGVAQAPGGPQEDPEGGFTHGGWQAPLLEEDRADAVFEQAKTLDVLLLGRRTYDIFAAYWPQAPAGIPWTSLLNAVPKRVASRTLSGDLGWQNSSLIPGDLATAVGELRQRHEHVHVIGSLGLVQSLLRLDLVDRLHLWQYPVLLGSGKRVFGEGTIPAALHLAEGIVHPGGTVQLTYDRIGVPTYGDMTQE
ncbi:dihydrofolate reductase family protein [Kineosporia sp. J2-2]|uniref:Dihydrofolate reductase family protein n=1 Tax=Kineosporia corallincola TaxID=2835133 RepID=A0ABS5TR45_9ACTN|nr:dihydrofolate reductase family protein [Kineosporia corallincola]MBT0773216.1 dihydrofolate reductase family protein [Kineosporia corallincola]